MIWQVNISCVIIDLVKQKNMFETSKDLLNLLLGVSVALVAVLFSWVLFEIGRMIKGVNDTINGMKKLVNSVNEVVDKFKDKAGEGMAYLTVLIKSGQEVMKLIQKKKASTDVKRKSKKKTKETTEEEKNKNKK